MMISVQGSPRPLLEHGDGQGSDAEKHDDTWLDAWRTTGDGPAHLQC